MTRIWQQCTLCFLLFFLPLISFAQNDDEAIDIGDTIASSEHQQNLTYFFNAVEIIKKNYVKPVSEKKLYQDAVRGMLEGLDPHSTYLDEEDLKFLNDTTSGQYVGIGLELTQDKQLTKVVSALDDSPAQKAHVKPGDILLKINNVPIIHMGLQDVIKKLQGKENSSLDLTLYRQGSKSPFTIHVKRERIQLKSVKSQLLKPGYGYIRIAYFQENTPKETTHAINEMKKQSDGNLKGIIIDLRNNPGGLLDSAIDVTDHFIDGHKPIVSARGRTPESIFAVNSTAEDITHNVPLVVLINRGSASGSEIMAGALQDYHRAIIMGEASFGKGSVQTVIPLNGASAIKLTTSLYYTPSGRSIQAKGIVPDIKVENKLLSNTAESDDAFDMKESELSNHLTVNKSDDNAQKNTTKTTDYLAADYQVQEALHLLEGINVEKSQKQ